MSEDENSKSKENILNYIDTDEAFSILKQLIEEDANIEKKVYEIVMDKSKEVDIDSIAKTVYFDLDSIEVEDLWDSSGSTRYGYVDVVDRAREMFEETLDPYICELKKYRDRSMFTQEMHYCMGILKGIHKYEKKSNLEFKDWAPDEPKEFFYSILGDWKKRCKNKEDIEEMDSFIEKIS